MSRDLTTQQLTEKLSRMLSARSANVDPQTPNLRLHAALVECDGPSRTALLCFHTYPWMANPGGVTHGGMVAAILDVAMGVLCSAMYDGSMTPTITMTTNYARPVPLNADLWARSRCSHAGGTSAQLSTELYLAEDLTTPLATATGVYYTAKTKKS